MRLKGLTVMLLSSRLRLIAQTVRFRTVADIGTDHGYIPIDLALRGLIDKAVACDVKKGPLLRAAANIEKYNLTDKIECRLGDGLRPIQPAEFETAIIAGMGGLLVVNILKNALSRAKSLRQLVLQPQQDVPDVRRFLHTVCFRIDGEAMVFDSGHYYTVLSCSPGLDTTYTEEDYLFGKILLRNKDAVLRNAVLAKLEKTEKILARILETTKPSAAARRRLAALEQTAAACRSVLSRL